MNDTRKFLERICPPYTPEDSWELIKRAIRGNMRRNGRAFEIDDSQMRITDQSTGGYVVFVLENDCLTFDVVGDFLTYEHQKALPNTRGDKFTSYDLIFPELYDTGSNTD